MRVATINGYGFVHHNPDTGSIENIDDTIYLMIKHGHWTDFEMQKWNITHNVCEGFNVICYDIGMDKYCKTIEELVETLRLLLKGEL